MASLTQLGADDVVALAAAFQLGGLIAWGEIPVGTINSNYWVEAGGRRWFVRVNEGKSEADVRWEAELVAGLAAAGVATPAPALARDGAPLVRRRDRWVSVFPWVTGAHRASEDVSEGDARAVGAALAVLHRAGRPLASRMARDGIYTTRHIAARVARVAADPRAASDPALVSALPGLGAELDWLDARAEKRAALPSGIIHGDLFRDNVLFEVAPGAARETRVTALLDFEQASFGAWTYDLAVCLNAWCFASAGEFSPDLVRAMVYGYEAERALEPAERELLYVEARAAALRFTVTRITDVYLPGVSLEGKDFRRFLARLEAWRALGSEGLAVWLA